MANPSVAELVARVHDARARAGRTRVVLIDGPAGSGKTTLAEPIATALGSQVVHGDDLYEGWTGLSTLWTVLGEQVLEPLAHGDDAHFGRWDWEARGRAETVAVPQADFLVIEGVGVAQRQARPFASLTVWVEAPFEERLRRGMARDGEQMRFEWERWQRDEQEFFAIEGTRAAADVVVNGTEPVDGVPPNTL